MNCNIELEKLIKNRISCVKALYDNISLIKMPLKMNNNDELEKINKKQQSCIKTFYNNIGLPKMSHNDELEKLAKEQQSCLENLKNAFNSLKIKCDQYAELLDHEKFRYKRLEQKCDAQEEMQEKLQKKIDDYQLEMQEQAWRVHNAFTLNKELDGIAQIKKQEIYMLTKYIQNITFMTEEQLLVLQTQYKNIYVKKVCEWYDKFKNNNTMRDLIFFSMTNPCDCGDFIFSMIVNMNKANAEKYKYYKTHSFLDYLNYIGQQSVINNQTKEKTNKGKSKGINIEDPLINMWHDGKMVQQRVNIIEYQELLKLIDDDNIVSNFNKKNVNMAHLLVKQYIAIKYYVDCYAKNNKIAGIVYENDVIINELAERQYTVIQHIKSELKKQEEAQKQEEAKAVQKKKDEKIRKLLEKLDEIMGSVGDLDQCDFCIPSNSID